MGGIAQLEIAVKKNAAQAPPPAMYLLAVSDPKSNTAWYAVHSAY